MAFRENLLHLRAANNMTQEQLAVRLGVSRQSVAKWEAGKSNPEMDKLLAMCDLFGCTLDALVTGDLTEAAPTPSLHTQGEPKDLFGYDEAMRSFGSKIPTGVAAIILGVALGTLFFGLTEELSLFPENLGAALGLLCVFLGVGIGLALIIPAGLAHSAFMKAHPYLEDFYTAEQKAQARTAFAYQLVSGIACIFVGICIIIAIGETPVGEAIGPCILMTFVAIGVWLIIHGSMTLGRVDIPQYNENAAEVATAEDLANAPIPDGERTQLMTSRRTNAKISAVCGTIMIVATIIALCLLFIPMAQGDPNTASERTFAFFWLPWPLGGLLCGIVAMLMKAFSKDDQH